MEREGDKMAAMVVVGTEDGEREGTKMAAMVVVGTEDGERR